jgi:hypothetical protein
VEWDSDPGVQEVQSIVTSVYTGANEIQSVVTTAKRVDEKQVVTTSATQVKEIQNIIVSQATSGYFFVTLDTSTTGGSKQDSGYIFVNYPASGSSFGRDVQSIISAMSNVDAGVVVTLTKPNADTSIYSVTFPLSMGNVPQLTVHTQELGPAGASAIIETPTEGNVISGTFTLSYGDQTTAAIAYDATEDDVRIALEALSTIGTVVVTRSASDYQHGYKWTIVFNSDMNSGNIPSLTSDNSGLAGSNNKISPPTISVVSDNGNELGGTFNILFQYGNINGMTNNIAFDASANDFKDALEKITNFPKGAVAVTRTGPDNQLGYAWTISFLENYARTFEGDIPLLTIQSGHLLTGIEAKVTVNEVRKGTFKEIQQIAVKTTSLHIGNSTVMELSYKNQTTIPIYLKPGSSSSCDSSVVEVQTITSSTIDTSLQGGDHEVSMYLEFRLIYDNEITGWIKANQFSSSDCSSAAGKIQEAIETLSVFPEVVVRGESLNSIQMSCVWTITFVSSQGDISQLQVLARNLVDGNALGQIGHSSKAADDTISIKTIRNGEKDAIKYALELLDNIGTVTVTPTSTSQSSKGECTWLVTFDTNSGNLPLLQVVVYNGVIGLTGGVIPSSAFTYATDTVTITEIKQGTSSIIGGNFALTFRGARSIYVPYDADARSVKIILEALTTIGQVEVTRSVADENNGYTWLVTFLTELGSLDLIEFDDSDMTGTVVTGVVSKDQVGISPPFNSLDSVNRLPLGSAVITNLSDLELTVHELDEGIAYYFRVAAINSVGQGPYAFSSIPYAIPQYQRPGRPVNPTLSIIDGSTLQATFEPPALDGGYDVTFYKIEYAETQFAVEVQAIDAHCHVMNEVQLISSQTSHQQPEEQLLFISTTFHAISPVLEVQKVVCDASGGSFLLTFNGYTSQRISYSADAVTIQNALENIQIINSVTVSFTGGINAACFQRNSGNTNGGFLITFNDVTDMSGNLPLLTATTNSLMGSRYIHITKQVTGDAGIGGTYRLSFRGSITEDIQASIINNDYNGAAAAIKLALQELDTISFDAITVTNENSNLVGAYGQLYRIRFVSPDLGGNIDAIQVVQYFNKLTGSNVAINVFTDGLETTQQRGGSAFPSIAGNEISGSFTVSYRGHTTDLIDFSVSETVLVSTIQSLPNINTVSVQRSGPSVYKEYQWTVTFTSMPGAYPPGTENVLPLVPNYSLLLGNASKVLVTELQAGSEPLGGSFSLTMTSPSKRNNHENIEVAGGIPADASASELASYLNALETIGTVSVSRVDLVDGYQWKVTFDGCKIVNGTDVCTVGNVPLLGVNNTLMSCGYNNNNSPITIDQIVEGSGPSTNCDYNNDDGGMCQGYVTDLSGPQPYSYLITKLTAGNPYYARIFAHNSISYGYPVNTRPEFLIPTYNRPESPPPVRLVSSTSNSITVEWDYPRENGGATVEGFQLYVDDWQGGNIRLAYDGINQPDRLSFTVTSTTSFVLETGKSYRFLVRAVNYCFATDILKACLSDFSAPSVFTVRNPRAPIAPPKPYHSSKSNIGLQSVYGDGAITIRFVTTTDNGGSPITGYYLHYAAPDDSSYHEINLGLNYALNDANGHLVYEYTLNNIKEGNVYRFYIVAANLYGKSGASPILSTVVGMLPGLDASRFNVYAQISPMITSVNSNEMTVNWPMPPSNCTGSIPITGYKLYQYAGVGINTYANPRTVYNEIQMIQTSVDAKSAAVQQINIPKKALLDVVNTYSLSVSVNDRWYTGSQNLTLSSPPTVIATYLNNLFLSTGNIRYSNMSTTVSSYSDSTDSKSYTVKFNGYDGIVADLVVTTVPASSTSIITTISPGTEKIGGSFTLSFNGSMSVDLPYSVSALEMKASLEDIPGVGTVSVTRTSNFIHGNDRNAYTWLVTFDSNAGDLPLLYATAGRLTPLSSHVAISVSQVVQGTDVDLVYDGTGIPDVRSYVVSNLIADTTYSFKVAPVNALGEGILSKETKTVVATSGSSPLYTTAQGSSLSLGITDNVDEQQIITAKNCNSSSLLINFGNYMANISSTMDENLIQNIFENVLLTGEVDISHDRMMDNSQTIDTWRIIFINSGDVSLLHVKSNQMNCRISVEEFIKGSRNQFTIQPKMASGAVLKDVTIAAGFAGKDIFVTETFYSNNNSWYRDQGVASYNPQIYEIQEIRILSTALNNNIRITLEDYLTPSSSAIYNSGYFTSSSSLYDVQTAIKQLNNVENVDVQRQIYSDNSVGFMITFLTNLGNVPLMNSSSDGVIITEQITGVCEVQTITIASDDEFIREENAFRVSNSVTHLKIVYLHDSSSVIIHPISSASIESAFKTLYGPNGAPVVVQVTSVMISTFTDYTVKFISPVGDVSSISVFTSTNGKNYSSIIVEESVKGISPVSGTFTIFYEGYYTNDIDHDASAAQVKNALENLPSVSTVNVYRNDTNTGFKWTVSFTEDVGNLRMMEASDIRYEIQRLWTAGGTPTPLSGQIQLTYGNSESILIDYDATAFELQAALQSMSSIGHTEVSRDTYTNGQYSWLITFRDLIDNIENLGISNRYLFGSNATVYIETIVNGNHQTLLGPNPTLTVYEKEAGKPDYTAVYTIDTPGYYHTKVMQLTSGGLNALYYDNQWFYGTPSISRIDPTINFDWSTGFITSDSSDYVSVTWSGKLIIEQSAIYIFYLLADDSAIFNLNHTLLIDASDVCCIEHRASIYLEAGMYYQFDLNYIELTGTSSISLKYSSSFIRKQVIPPSAYYNGIDIVGSPFLTTIVPGAADYPYTTAYGIGLTNATAGRPASFYIQTKDADGNNQTVDYEHFDPLDLLKVTITNGPTIYYGTLEYLGNGLFITTYTPLKAGQYQLQIQMGEKDVYCGLGELNKCSPFALLVLPGPSIPMTSEVESPSKEKMDYLIEAVVGEYGELFIQAKDAFSNNQIIGGDLFKVIFTLKSNSNIQYRGNVDDNNDGTYTVKYTITTAGYYDVAVTLSTSSTKNDESILSCIGATYPFIYNRVYDGLHQYVTPSFCALRHPTLHVVHNDISAFSSTYNDMPLQSLSLAEVGIINYFTIEARDIFGNLRFGDNTTHFDGYGNGNSDYFLVEFTQPESGDYYRRSSAIDTITATNVPPSLQSTGYFRLSFGGRTTADIPSSISQTGLEAILERLHDFQLNVIVTKTTLPGSSGTGTTTTTWSIEFLTMLNVWQSMPPSGPATGQQLTLLPSSLQSAQTFFQYLTITRPGKKGIYPVSYTLWNTGTYNVRITNNNIDIQGSPCTLFVQNAPVDPTSSIAFGKGLIGGVAGEQLSITIQAKDTRQYSIQYLTTLASVVSYTSQIQSLNIPISNPITLSFRGQSLPSAQNIGTYNDLKTQLTNLGTLGSFTLLDPATNAPPSSLSSSIAGKTVWVRFDSLVGSLPLISGASPSSIIQPGDAPYRSAVQVIQCKKALSETIITITLDNGDKFNSSISFSASSATLSSVQTLMTQTFNVGSITLSNPKSGSTGATIFCGSTTVTNTIFVQFNDVKGYVDTLKSSSASITKISIDPNDGALAPLFPITGTFTLGIHNENTTSLSVVASANDVQNALRELYSIGDITVLKDTYGIALDKNNNLFYTDNNYIFTVWTVIFDAVCNGNLGGIASGSCPSSLIDEPLLYVNNDNIKYTPSPYEHQDPPKIIAESSLKGYGGNIRLNYDDYDSISIRLQGRTTTAMIGMNSIQRLYCRKTSLSNSHFAMQFLNVTVQVDASWTATALQQALSSAFVEVNSNFMITTVSNSSNYICGDFNESITYISFIQPSGVALPIIQVIQAINVQASVYPYIQPIDSFTIVSESLGLYQINYTPTVSDIYDIFVTIDGIDVSNDLTAGIEVIPTLEYSATSTHNASHVSVEGIREYLTVQLRDRFGNNLISSLSQNSKLLLNLEGISDNCQLDSISGIINSSIPLTVLQIEPYNDGIYTIHYDPSITGDLSSVYKCCIFSIDMSTVYA